MKSKLMIIVGCISAIFSCVPLQKQYFAEDFIDSVDVSNPGEINVVDLQKRQGTCA